LDFGEYSPQVKLYEMKRTLFGSGKENLGWIMKNGTSKQLLQSGCLSSVAVLMIFFAQDRG